MAKGMRILCFLGFCSVLSPGLLGQKRGLSVVKEWHQLDWTYPTDAARQQAISTGEFVRGNGVPIDVEVFHEGNNLQKVFVTVPRFIDGIPGTLNTISKNSINGNPLLEPYPSWDWHRNSAACKPNRLISVFRIQLDECGRLWVLDTGKIGSNQMCSPQIIAFNPSTNQVIHRYEIPKDDIVYDSLLVTPVVDVRNFQSGCHDTFVYAADVTGFGLVVYDMSNRRSWRIYNKLFYPIPEFGTFTIAGESFDLMDGILGMSLSPFRPGFDRVLYFHALASNTENYVYTSVIRNGTLFHGNSEAAPREFEVFQNKRHSQSAAEAIDKNGVMFFGLAKEIAIACWNTNSQYDQKNIDLVDRNQDTLQFASGVKVVNNGNFTQELWVLTCRFQKVMTGTMSATEVNFRILTAPTADLLRGSRCKNSRGPGNSSGGGYGLVNRPQQSWGSIFSDGRRPPYGQNSAFTSSSSSSAVSSSGSSSSTASTGSGKFPASTLGAGQQSTNSDQVVFMNEQ